MLACQNVLFEFSGARVTRILLFNYPFRRELLGAASDGKRKTALVVPQLYNQMRKILSVAALSDNFPARWWAL